MLKNFVKIGSVKTLLMFVHAFLSVMSVFIQDMNEIQFKKSKYIALQYIQLCVNHLSKGRNFLIKHFMCALLNRVIS